eukprot:TRINITY_DN9092_c0_g1_i2.p1 TRINITY_DN9092_c0_g1~~TRINITY_DN9092_c0_g1_i2.p1  ORF type:complete len:441 (-),score=38.08 TRINITY_DN9092_c0_g1_i2:132-1454(-)
MQCVERATVGVFFVLLVTCFAESRHEWSLLRSIPQQSADRHEVAKKLVYRVDQRPAVLTPLVIIPSLIGSRLEAQLDGKVSQHWYCSKNSKPFWLWLPETAEMVPPFDNCWAENIALTFDNATGLYHSLPGVSVTAPYFGQLQGVEYLDANNKTGVWDVVVETLVALGYEPGVNLVSAPYDWRVGPTQVVAQQFGPLKALIEQTYSLNGNTPVALTSLSMGGLYGAVFLNSFVDQAWKDQHIASFTSLSGAFGGSVISIYELLCLNGQNLYGLDPVILREVVRSWGSPTWLLPTPGAYNSTMVITPERNYTAADFVQLFTDAEVPVVVEIMESSMQYFAPGPVGVPLNVVYGFNLSTMASLEFSSNTNFTEPSGVTFDNGDGTVTLGGLIELPQQWAAQQTQPVQFFGVANMPHGNATHTPEAVQIILQSLGFTMSEPFQ